MGNCCKQTAEQCAQEASRVHILAGAAIRKKFGLAPAINAEEHDKQVNSRRDHKGEQGYTDEVDCCGNCIQRVGAMCGFGAFIVSYFGGCDNHTRVEVYL